jgi:crotonobetainyl-CoA:carnitine CoA-transferase CaiB-like acyl-CoA transferase
MRALDGIRVLDMARFVAGPFCCQILGDNGADVIKVERAEGEPARRMPPFYKGESLYFMAYNGSKRGISLDLRSRDGLALLRRLILKADIVVENFRAGTMEKMGLGYDSLAREHPGLIMVSISGFGTEGPCADLPAFDEIIQAMSGLTSLTGDAGGPPLLTGTYVSDFLTGVYAALGAVMALQGRAQSGRGQWVRLNLLHCLVSILNTTIPRYLALGEAPRRQGNRNPLIAPGNLYRAQDGYVTIECLAQEQWEDLARAMGREDLLREARFRDVVSRQEHGAALDELIAAWMRDKSVEAVLEILRAHSVPSGPVLDIPALVKHPQFEANRMAIPVDVPSVGPVPLLAPPIRMDADTSARRERPPRQGEHSADVLSEWLGLEPEEVARLRVSGVLKGGPA